MSVLSRNFLTVSNILNVLHQTSINGIIAFGMTLVILIAGIDLSVGSILAFGASIVAIMLRTGVSPLFALLVGIAIGLLVGAANGALIAYGKLQAFIVTLSTMTIFRGLTLVITKRRPVSISESGDLFQHLGTGYFLGIPIPVYILFFFFLLLWFLLQRTVVGRHLYALGATNVRVMLRE